MQDYSGCARLLLGPCLVLVAAVAISGLALLGVLPLDAARPEN